MPFWTEIRGDHFEFGDVIDPLDGDMLASISIDAWKTADENEQGNVIARVILSKHGDVLVDYHDSLARMDEMAQEKISEAKSQLRDYYLEIQNQKDTTKEKLNSDTVQISLSELVRSAELKADDRRAQDNGQSMMRERDQQMRS